MRFIALLTAVLCCSPVALSDPIDDVNVFIGTDGLGHTYPGATVPFGMVQLSPDTRLEDWSACGGYQYVDTSIIAFSHTHLSGTGALDMGDIAVMPAIGDATAAVRSEDPKAFSLKFSHDKEKASPGVYSVRFDNGIFAELTATAHTGVHRYAFPKSDKPFVIIDMDHGIGTRSVEAQINVIGNDTLVGFKRTRGWAWDKSIYFAIQFSRPFTSNTIDSRAIDAETADKSRQHVRGGFYFDPSDQPLIVRVGLSPTSPESALRNLQNEVPDWNFDRIASDARKHWQQALSSIEIQASDNERRTFYTSLYHVMLAPMQFNDVDGAYRGADGKNHPSQGFVNYDTFSLWDTFRAEHPLLTIIQPSRVSDFVRSMLAHQQQFKEHTLPVWTLGGKENWCMIGYHSVPVIADAYLKGFRNFDAEAVYQAMKTTAMQSRNGQDLYQKLGYVPFDVDIKTDGAPLDSVSRTLEYAYDDVCIARMAEALGKTEDAKYFAGRADHFRNLFDQSTGFMRGKSSDGKWFEPFSATKEDRRLYTEANAWHYLWSVPHDIPSLITLMGGDDAFVKKLDEMFASNQKSEGGDGDITGLLGLYAHGNEPCHHVAYLYDYANAAPKTQQKVRQIMSQLYSTKPDGLCGNDDCGQTSAWYVFSAMGFYEVDPSSGVYVIGSPSVDRAMINLDPKFYKGKTFTITAKDNSPQNVYIQKAELNGKPLDRAWFTHEELAAGGELTLYMGPTPNPQWGASNRPGIAVRR